MISFLGGAGGSQEHWNIVDSTPYGKDVVRQLAEACKEHGIKLFLYYSPLDWGHADYFPRGTVIRYWLGGMRSTCLKELSFATSLWGSRILLEIKSLFDRCFHLDNSVTAVSGR